ncbi:MAG: hypothetical protein PHV33_14115 [Elusimicrobiales bacterium]|nr:hypothetical protein [Elusimicrobiales bacterium]
MTNNGFAKITCCAILGASLSACGGSKTVEVPKIVVAPASPSAPMWAKQLAASFNDGYLYGVGVVTDISDKSLAVDTADQRARENIAKMINVKLDSVHKDFSMSNKVGATQIPTQDVGRKQGGKTEMNLSGAIPIEHWFDPVDGSVYSLVKLDTAAVKAALNTARESDPQFQKYITENSKRLISELASEKPEPQ